MALNVSKWQAARPGWSYTPTMWFYKRMVEVALLEAFEMGADGTPTDAALLARNWIATSEMEREQESEFIAFPKCCDVLGVDAERERWGLLNLIDSEAARIGMDFDTDECWSRLEHLMAQPLSNGRETSYSVPLWARVVPAVDQAQLWPETDGYVM